MKHSFICLTAASLLANALSAQEKIGVYLQAGPWLHINSYKTTGTGKTHMPAFQLSPGAGLEVEIPVSPKYAVVPFAKIYGQKQMVVQRDTEGMFTDDSYFRLFNDYLTINFGAFAQYKMAECKQIDWQLLAGLSFSHASASANGSDYKLNFDKDGPYSIIMGSENNIDNFERKANFFNISLGTRLATHIRKVGDFKFGFVAYVPLGRMPDVSYVSEFTTDNQKLYTNTHTSNRQFNLECTISYRLFGWRV